MYKNNVIHIKDFKKEGGRKPSRRNDQQKALNKSPELHSDHKTEGHNKEIVDITQRREEALKRDRRLIKRTILTEFISAYAIIPQRGLESVALSDISKKGLAFELVLSSGCFKVGEELAMRIYLNHQTFFPFLVKVSHVDSKEGDIYKVGVQFLKAETNSVALEHFVDFIETVSAGLRSDSGDILVSPARK